MKKAGRMALAMAIGFLGAAQAAMVDTAASKVEWVGKKVTGQHNGTVNIKSGELTVEKKTVMGGNIVLDMASIAVLDLKDPDYNGKLTGHLKSNDFFSVEKNPTATFKLTKLAPIAGAKAGEVNTLVTGDLTIKGITQSLSFPAAVTVGKKGVKAVAKDIKVDRTKYGIRYGSGKFFQGLGDKVIYDDFLISFSIVAK